MICIDAKRFIPPFPMICIDAKLTYGCGLVSLGMHASLSGCPPQIRVNIGRIERGLVVMGCGNCVRVLYSIKQGDVERGRGSLACIPR